MVGSRATLVYCLFRYCWGKCCKWCFPSILYDYIKNNTYFLWVLDCSMLQFWFMWVLRLWFLLLPVTSFKDVVSSWNYLAVALVPNSIRQHTKDIPLSTSTGTSYMAEPRANLRYRRSSISGSCGQLGVRRPACVSKSRPPPSCVRLSCTV